MIRKVKPVTEKVSTIVLIYTCSIGASFLRAFFFKSEGPTFAVENMESAFVKGAEPLLPGLLMLVLMWFFLWILWRFGGEAKHDEARQAYKKTLPEIERHLYEIEEYGAKLPDGPKRKKNWLGFWNLKKNLS